MLCIFLTTAISRCIEALVRFILPILNLICEAMGWKATLLAGGPEPAMGGRLNMARCV